MYNKEYNKKDNREDNREYNKQYNRRYDKKILMLRQESAGYSITQKTPWGSAVIEIKKSKGTIVTRVQGLKPLLNNEYGVYLINDNQLMFCENIKIDCNGIGEATFEFFPDDVFLNKFNSNIISSNDNTYSNLNIKIEDILGVLIVAKGKEEIVVPLAGYTGDKVSWKGFNIVDELEPSNIGVLDRDISNIIFSDVDNVIENNLDENNLDDEYLIKASEVATPKKSNFIINIKSEDENSHHGNFRGLINKFKNELKELQKEGIFNDMDINKIHKAGEKDIENYFEDTINKKEEYLGMDKDILTNSININGNTNTNETDIEELGNNEEIKAKRFKKDINENNNVTEEKKYKPPKRFTNQEVTPFEDNDYWKSITLDELLIYPMFPLKWQRELFFLYPMKKYNHFLYKEAHGMSYLAVPSHKDDVNDFEEEALEFGFLKFVPMENSNFGYWVCKRKN